MRLKSAIWVAAYIRRCHVEGAFAAVRRRGAEEAGAIFVKLNRLDGTAELFGPAPQSAFDEARPADRRFSRCLSEQPEAKIEERLCASCVSIPMRGLSRSRIVPVAISSMRWLLEQRPVHTAALLVRRRVTAAAVRPPDGAGPRIRRAVHCPRRPAKFTVSCWT